MDAVPPTVGQRRAGGDVSWQFACYAWVLPVRVCSLRIMTRFAIQKFAGATCPKLRIGMAVGRAMSSSFVEILFLNLRD